jgi:hypothetical protein
MSLVLVEEDVQMADEERGEDTERIPRQDFGRREYDKAPSDWQKPGFWLSVLGFLLTIVLVVLSAIWNKLGTIEGSVQAAAVVSGSQAKELEFQKRELDEFKRLQRAQDDLRDTYITNVRERIVKLEAKEERGKP